MAGPQNLVTMAVAPVVEGLLSSDPFLSSDAGRTHRSVLRGPLVHAISVFFLEHGSDRLHAEAEQARRFYEDARDEGRDPYDTPPGGWPVFVHLLVDLQRTLDD